ncbi:MAG TPA: hypothetical protein V6D19_00215 [Stenomitos sp.]
MPKLVQPVVAVVELITAQKEGNYGPYRSVLFKDGENKIWQSFDPDAEELQLLKKGQRVQLVPRGESKGGKTQYNLVLLDAPSAPTAQPTPRKSERPALLSDEQKRDTAAYIEQMAKLYRYCLEQATLSLKGVTDDPDTIRAAASTLFIAAQRRLGV